MSYASSLPRWPVRDLDTGLLSPTWLGSDTSTSEGLEDPFLPSLPRLHYVLRGVNRSQGEEGGDSRERLPITPPLLHRIKAIWECQASDPDTVMLWAACCLAFFGFLRAGEFTVPGDTGYDYSTHLSWGDLAVDDPVSFQD